MARPMPIAPSRTRTSGPRCHATAPVMTPGQQAAEGPEREQRPGERPAALLVGERDGDHLGGAEQAAQARPAPPAAAAASARAAGVGRPHGCAAGPGAARCRAARPGRGCRRGRRRPRCPRPTAGCTVVASTVTRIGPRMKTVSSTTASSANAVCRSAGRSCSTWLQRARTQVPIVGRPAPATAASGHTTHAGPAGRHRGHEQAGGAGVHQHQGQQHPRLAEPVEQPALQDRERRVGDDVDGRHGAGQPVGPGGGLHQQHDPEAHHRDREPAGQSREAHPPPAGDAQDATVRAQHDGPSLRLGGRADPLGAPRPPGCRRPGPARLHTMGGMSPEVAPYDALLLVSFGGPEAARRRHPVPGERHPWQEHPARAAGRGRRALLPVRRPLADQRPEPGAARRDPRGPRRRRDRPAGLLGQPQLGPLPRPTRSGRWPPTGSPGRPAS